LAGGYMLSIFVFSLFAVNVIGAGIVIKIWNLLSCLFLLVSFVFDSYERMVACSLA
jgi:hypothetical protein